MDWFPSSEGRHTDAEHSTFSQMTCHICGMERSTSGFYVEIDILNYGYTHNGIVYTVPTRVCRCHICRKEYFNKMRKADMTMNRDGTRFYKE